MLVAPPSPHSFVTTKNVSRFCQWSPGGKIAPSIENHWSSVCQVSTLWITAHSGGSGLCQEKKIRWLGKFVRPLFKQWKIVSAFNMLSNVNFQQDTLQRASPYWLQTLYPKGSLQGGTHSLFPFSSWAISQVRKLRSREVAWPAKGSAGINFTIAEWAPTTY